MHLRFAFDKRDISGRISFYILSRVEEYARFDKSKLKRCEEIEGQKEFVALAIEHIEGKIPAEYSKRIIDYMSKHSVNGDKN